MLSSNHLAAVFRLKNKMGDNREMVLCYDLALHPSPFGNQEAGGVRKIKVENMEDIYNEINFSLKGGYGLSKYSFLY